MNQNHSTESTNTIGNAIELATRIIGLVSGDLISSNLGGGPATSAVISQTVAAKMIQKLRSDGGAPI